MEASTFFSRLLRPPGLGRGRTSSAAQPDDVGAFERAWTGLQATLLQPDESQLLRGIHSTDVPRQLDWLVKALVYESSLEEQGKPTGGCLEYFLNEGVLGQLVQLSEADLPFGIRAELYNAINTFLLLLPDSFLVHSAVHRPLLRLVRASISLNPENSRVDNAERAVGAAAVEATQQAGKEESERVTEERVLNMLAILCAKVKAYPLLLLILFHDRLSPEPTHRNRSAPSAGRAALPDSSTTTSSLATIPAHLDYLIFSHLLQYVHYEGRMGECARVGATCLFDLALGDLVDRSTSPNGTDAGQESDAALHKARISLAERIFDGDSADVLAAGLGAVYSVLPFKIRLPTAEEANEQPESGMRLGTNGNGDLAGSSSATEQLHSLRSEDVRDQLALLMEICRFVDDIISRCDGVGSGTSDARIKEIASALVQRIRKSLKLSFLDNVLYPSILECSGSDGSATAVLSYLRVLLRLDRPGSTREELADQILAYLLGLEELSADDLHSRRAKRASHRHLTSRFTLKDLLLDVIATGTSEAGATALNLCSGLLDVYCDLSVPGLLACIDDDAATSFSQDLLMAGTHRLTEVDGEYGKLNRPLMPQQLEDTDGLANAFRGLATMPHTSCLDAPPLQTVKDADVELYSALVGRLMGHSQRRQENPAEQVYLAEGYASLCRHTCFQAGLAAVDVSPGLGGRNGSSIAQRLGAYRLDPADAMLQELLKSLRHFFGHPAEFNVALTGALSSLANCPCRSLRGWLLKLPPKITESDVTYASKPPSAVDVFTDDNPFLDDGEDRLPIMYQTLRELTKQVAVYRSRVADFDRLLDERRRGLLFVEGMEDAMDAMLEVVPTQTSGPGWTPVKGGAAGATESPPSVKRSRTSGLSASLVSFLTPRKKTSQGPDDTNSGSPFSLLSRRDDTSAPSTPFAMHYQRTKGVSVEPLAVADPKQGAWSPSNTKRAAGALTHGRSVSGTASLSESTGTSSRPFVGSKPEDDGDDSSTPARRVSLSQVLDNCVILEEFIKETIGHIAARRTLGVDTTE